MACINLGTFSQSISSTGLCLSGATVTIYGDNINTIGEFLYFDPSCTVEMGNYFYSDGLSIIEYVRGVGIVSITNCSGCNTNYCIFNSDQPYEGEYNLSLTYNGYDYFTGATNGYFIYYSLTDDSWCLSTSLGGTCEQFGPSGVGSTCPDLDTGFFSPGLCPTTTTTTTSPCNVFDYDAIFDCLVPTTTTTTTSATTTTTTTTIPPDPCSGVSMSASITAYTTTTTTIPVTTTTTTEVIRPCNFDGIVQFNIFDEYMRCGNTKKFEDCLTGINYYSSDVILTPIGLSPTQQYVYKITVNGISVCAIFLGLVDNISGIDTITIDEELGPVQEGYCLVCVPDPTPTPIPCDCYSLRGGSLPAGSTFSYNDCNEVYSEITVGRGDTGYTCSSSSITLVSGNGSVIGLVGECIDNICPTTTTTTTIPECIMTEYLLVNQGGTVQEYQYKICGFKAPVNDVLPAFHSLVICSSIPPIGYSNLLQITPTGNFCS